METFYKLVEDVTGILIVSFIVLVVLGVIGHIKTKWIELDLAIWQRITFVFIGLVLGLLPLLFRFPLNLDEPLKDKYSFKTQLNKKAQEAQKALVKLADSETWKENTAKWRQKDYMDLTTGLGDVSDEIKYRRIKDRLKDKILVKEAQIEKNIRVRSDEQEQRKTVFNASDEEKARQVIDRYNEFIAKAALENIRKANADHLKLLKILLADVESFEMQKRSINDLLIHMRKVMRIP